MKHSNVDDSGSSGRQQRNPAARNGNAAHVDRGEGVRARFVVQKHDARRVHFDLRLEIGGVLKSWAINQGPSLDPSDRRLAVRTDDAPADPSAFKSGVPDTDYTAGSLVVWDQGFWRAKGDAQEGLENGVLKFVLEGRHLKGGYTLVRLGKKPRDLRENWLLIKERDRYASRRDGVAERWWSSIASGKAMDDIAASAAGRDKPQSRRGRRPKARPTAVERAQGGDPDPHPGAAQPSRAPLPSFVAPQLAVLAGAVPEGEGWVHEIKYDGYRAVVAIAGGEVRFNTRSGLDWTDRFVALVPALARLPAKTALIDGEVVVFDGEGRSDFGALQQALNGSAPAALSYVAFDLLFLDGRDLRSDPLLERKAKLARLLKQGTAHIHYGDHVVGRGASFLASACRSGLEGIVSKRADAPYVSRRTPAWLKIKCSGRDEFVIVGFRRSTAKGRPFASILVGEHADGRLAYRGRVGTGFDERELDQLAKRFAALARRSPPIADVPREVVGDVTWLEPELVAEIAYGGRTRDGILRHARYLGLREDKRARDVVARASSRGVSGRKRAPRS